MTDNPTKPATIFDVIQETRAGVNRLWSENKLSVEEYTIATDKLSRAQLLGAAMESSNRHLAAENAKLAENVAHWRDAANVCRATLGTILDNINMKPSQHIGRFTRMSWRSKIAAAIDALDDADKEEPCKLTT